RRREAREENAKYFSLVAALLLCENGLSWHGRPRPCKVGSNLRARQEIRCTFCCWPPGPLARRERRAYPLRYVRSEQHSQRACWEAWMPNRYEGSYSDCRALAGSLRRKTTYHVEVTLK